MFYERLKNGPQTIRLAPTQDLRPFAPNVAGRYPELNSLTLATANRLGPVLRKTLASFLGGNPEIEISNFSSRFGLEANFSDALGGILARHGSDKSTVHNYHIVYGSLFPNPNSVSRVLEIGIGTNSPDVLSTMGSAHKGVGGSLRAWRDFFPEASIVGFDIDPRALFSEERIQTFQLDQLNEDSLHRAFASFETNSVDLFIDDGLHTLDANLIPLMTVFPLIRRGGWVVIEDIHSEAVPYWEAIASALPKASVEAAVIRAKSAHMFVLRKT